MGKKRITTIDLSKEEKKAKKHSGSGRMDSLGVKGKKTEIVAKKKKSAKQQGHPSAKATKGQGRITDMGQVMLEEMESRLKVEDARHEVSAKREKEGLLLRQLADSEVAAKKKSEVAAKKKSRPKKTRSTRYQTLRKLIKSERSYPLPEAIELLKKSSNAKFNETVELHLIAFETGKLSKDIKTEKKFPLAHIKIGKTKETKKKLEEKIQAIFQTIGPNKIKKAVLTSTMSPGIKIELSQPDK